MLKPASVRDALTAAIVDAAGVRIFERDPANLRIWSDKGRIAARHGPELGFEYRYRLNLLVMDFAGSEDAVVLTLVEWVRIHQPDLLLNHSRGDQAIPFEVDVIQDADSGSTSVDLLFELELSETVRVVPRDGGGFDLVHELEPPVDPILDGAPARPPLAEVYLGDELVIGAA